MAIGFHDHPRYIRNVLSLEHTEQKYDLLKHNCLCLKEIPQHLMALVFQCDNEESS